MPSTFTQIHIQVVFATKYRDACISKLWKDRLHKYIIAIINNNGHKALAVNSMPDHIHLFFGFRPVQALSDLMRLIKGDSSEWINKQKFTRSKFKWQEGYGAFSYSKKDCNNVIRYIVNQEIHHQQKKFLEEYKEMLLDFGIEYDKRFIFHLPD